MKRRFGSIHIEQQRQRWCNRWHWKFFKRPILRSLLMLDVNVIDMNQCSPAKCQRSHWRWRYRWCSVWKHLKAPQFFEASVALFLWYGNYIKTFVSAWSILTLFRSMLISSSEIYTSLTSHHETRWILQLNVIITTIDLAVVSWHQQCVQVKYSGFWNEEPFPN